MPTARIAPGSRSLPAQLSVKDTSPMRGGEGSVYFSTDEKYVIKLYHRAQAADKQKMLEGVIELGRNLGDDERFLAWPLGVVTSIDNQPKIGVVMPRVPSSHTMLYNLIYSPIDAMEKFRQGRSWLDYLKIARGTAAALRAVHGKGIAHGDVHLKNFLADPASGEVVLIDLDGVIVKGFLQPQVVGMPGFIAPEVLMGAATPDGFTDRYSLAVLICWILLLRNVMLTQRCYDPDNPQEDDRIGYGKEACFSEHPTDHRNALPRIGAPLFRSGLLSYRALTPKLQELVERTLVQGLHEPQVRPQAVEWERALAEAYDVLIACTTCRQSYFYQDSVQPPPRRQCPFCGAGVRAPFPAVVELLEAKARGSYVPVRHMVLYQGLPLFGDVAEAGHVPPFTRRGMPVIGQTTFDAQERIHRLFNAGSDAWQYVAGGSGAIARGMSVALRPGTIFSFGDGKRLARVLE